MAYISRLEQQADLLMRNVSGWEKSTLERIGKRIKKYGKLSLADVKTINNIAETKSISSSTIKNLSNATGLNESEIIKISKAALSAKEDKILTNELNKVVVNRELNEITRELAKVTGYNISQIEQMYSDLLEEQHLSNKPLYDYRGKPFVPLSESRELQAIVKAYARATAETMVNLSKTKLLGFTDANGKFTNLQKAYTDVLDKAVIQVSTGATDFHTAMRDSIVQLGGSGVRVDYGFQKIKGKTVRVTRRLDTVVRQNLLWGAKQASIEYNNLIGKELGCDGIEIDWHSNPRPSHAGMQGKQYSIVGKKTIDGVTYEDAYEQGIDGEDGLLNDYGCLHYKTPIILGISEPRYSPEELERLNEQNNRTFEIDGKTVTGYDATQMQRRLETAVRKEKTIRDMARASGNPELVKACNTKIKAYQTKYTQISDITGIAEDRKRMSVPRSKKIKTPLP